MKLITAAIAAKLPPIGSTEKLGDDALVHLKLFTPDSSWTWYITEYEPETGTLFGLVDGFEVELGYISLDELKSVRGPLGLPIERDMSWDAIPLRDVRAMLSKRGG